MASDSNVIALQPRDYRPGNVTNLRRASIISFTEHRSLLSRYQDSCRQADVLNASVGELWLRAYLTSIQIALVIAGLHRPNDGASMCVQKTRETPKLSPDDAA